MLTEHAQQAVPMTELADTRRKRTFTIWAIALYFLYEGIGPIMTPFILQSGFPLPPPLSPMQNGCLPSITFCSC